MANRANYPTYQSVKITKVTYINNVPVENYSKEQLLQCLFQLEEDLKYLLSLHTQTKFGEEVKASIEEAILFIKNLLDEGSDSTTDVEV